MTVNRDMQEVEAVGVWLFGRKVTALGGISGTLRGA